MGANPFIYFTGINTTASGAVNFSTPGALAGYLTANNLGILGGWATATGLDTVVAAGRHQPTEPEFATYDPVAGVVPLTGGMLTLSLPGLRPAAAICT